MRSARVIPKLKKLLTRKHALTDQEMLAKLELGLLEQNLTAKNLSEMRTIDGNNAWHWLSGTDERCAVFAKIIDMNILPAADDLNRISNNNTSTWFWLSANKPRLVVFDKLLNMNIFPTEAILNKCRDTDSMSVWHWLASTYEGRKIFGRLLDMNIFPSAVTLNQCDMNSNENVWHDLAASDSIDLLKRLIAKNILPSPAALDACSKRYNTSAWFWLTGTTGFNFIFSKFLDLGILPSQVALNSSSVNSSGDTNTNVWFWLAVTPERHSLLNKLLDKNILPSAAALHACRQLDQLNVWFCLANFPKTGEDIAEKLVKRNILPEAENTFGTSEKNLALSGNWIKLLEKADYRRGILGCLTFFKGLHDKASPVSILSRNKDVLPLIFSHVDSRKDSVAHNKNHLFATVRKIHPELLQDHLRPYQP